MQRHVQFSCQAHPGMSVVLALASLLQAYGAQQSEHQQSRATNLLYSLLNKHHGK